MMHPALSRRGLFGLTLTGAFPIAARAAPARRIVSIGGDVSEIVWALGMGDSVIAVDATSLFPAEATSRPQVGYIRQLSAEPIIALAPDLILLSEGSGPAAAIAQLNQSGLAITRVPSGFSPAGVGQKIAVIGQALDRKSEADALQTSVAHDFAMAEAAAASYGKVRPKILFLMSAGQGTPMAAGRDTAANAIIELAHGQNVMADYSGYKTLSPEAAIAAAPDVILAMQQSVDQLGGKAAFLALPPLQETPAAKAGHLVAMDGLLLLGFGPRTPLAVETLTRAIRDLPPQ